MTGPRDWDKELANIDKVIAEGGGSASSGAGAQAPVRRASPAATSLDTPEPRGAGMTTGRNVAGVWFKVILGVLGAAALGYWPYPKVCGMNLYLYLIGVAAVLACSIWAMLASWKHRRGFAHVLAILVLLGGGALAAAEILPRVGFARTALTWTCP